ncbi:hypothetical protein H7J86_00565 [Mycobacterium hackensackense]|uniref:hypothetical protein n=1 Tax=Mycobacterium hackensackense TaxID=228909 RepID=UPI0022659F07|nr:hypothetical protein [Mycobacterium hackensackense]MCV7250653.1 hypothetical protein [Mycobacterium hackensackense]
MTESSPLETAGPPVDWTWLAQPIATVLAACIAISAAWLAYNGVKRSIANAREERDHTRVESRRAEKVALLTEALSASHLLFAECKQIANRTGEDRLDIERWRELTDANTLVLMRALLFGYDGPVKCAITLSTEASEIYKKAREDPESELSMDEISKAYGQLLTSLQAEFRALK